MSDKRVFLYDTTLRDGAQTMGVDFSLADKITISTHLDQLKIDYIEGGWPGANPVDTEFFEQLPILHHAKFAAFGMTRRASISVTDDTNFIKWLENPAPIVTMVGKSWDFQVSVALNISLEENLKIIHDSIAHATKYKEEVMFDAEHFFDGYRANPDYAIACLETALEAGARWVVLCDTNGGMLPEWVYDIASKVCQRFDGKRIGIHCHNDTDSAVANSLAAVSAGVRQVQGTINGLGERCGNANLMSIIPNLMLKMGYETGLNASDLTKLTQLSCMLDNRLNRPSDRHAPYVGASAFAHKGGLHASAVEKDARSYEHVPPESVGNTRSILVSNQAGRSNIVNRLRDIGLEAPADSTILTDLVEEVKTREFQGYAYDVAEASFELIARNIIETIPTYFTLLSYRVLDEKDSSRGEQTYMLTEATVKLLFPDGTKTMTVAEGNGPVNALDAALRKALLPVYPSLSELSLVDYKVRILASKNGTGAVTRVTIESGDKKMPNWSTVGLSANIIEASYEALFEAICYKLLKENIKPAQ